MKLHLYFILFLMMILASCLDDAPSDFDNPETDWNPSFSLAAGYTRLGMNEESGFDTLLLLINSSTGFPYWIEEIDIPLDYIMPFDLQELGQFSEQIVKIMFRINTYNGFPARAFAQVYFLDINNQIVDSLFSPDKLGVESGIISDDGELIQKNHLQTDVTISNDKIENLSDVRNLMIKGGINNLDLDSNLINFYPKYELDIQIGLQVELKMKIGESNNINDL